MNESDERYAEALAQAVRAERDRQTALAKAKSEHDKQVEMEAERVAAQHREVDAFRDSYVARNPEAVVTYCSMVLAASQYPDGFPQQHKWRTSPNLVSLGLRWTSLRSSESQKGSSAATSRPKTTSFLRRGR